MGRFRDGTVGVHAGLEMSSQDGACVSRQLVISNPWLKFKRAYTELIALRCT
jgi:hypothetical protein